MPTSRSLALELRGFEKVKAKLADPSLFANPLKEFFGVAARHGQRVARDGIRKGTRQAARSITSRVTPTGARVFSRMAAKRVQSIEQGRSPGDVPSLAAIDRWARKVGHPDDAWVIAQGIRRRGVRGRFFLEAARQSIQQNFPGWIRDMGQAISRRWRS